MKSKKVLISILTGFAFFGLALTSCNKKPNPSEEVKPSDGEKQSVVESVDKQSEQQSEQQSQQQSEQQSQEDSSVVDSQSSEVDSSDEIVYPQAKSYPVGFNYVSNEEITIWTDITLMLQ